MTVKTFRLTDQQDNKNEHVLTSYKFHLHSIIIHFKSIKSFFKAQAQKVLLVF